MEALEALKPKPKGETDEERNARWAREVEEEIELRRVDQHALETFQILGFKGKLPDELVKIYNSFKRTADTMRPGRLSHEGFASVVTLYRMLSE